MTQRRPDPVGAGAGRGGARSVGASCMPFVASAESNSWDAALRSA